MRPVSRLLAVVAALTVVHAGGVTAPPSAAAAVPSAPASRFVPVTPARLIDTREARQLAPGEVLDLPVTGRGAVPDGGVSAVVLVVTAVGNVGPGWVAAWPSGAPRPLVSNLNLDAPDQIRANQATVPVGDGGRVSFAASVAVDLVVDVSGYFVPAGGPVREGRFRVVPPARLLDTRFGARPAAWSARTVGIAGRAGVPTGAAAVVVTLTIVETAGPGFVTAWPSGMLRPLASHLNADGRGQIRATQVTVPLGANGAVDLFTNVGTHLLVDVVGWYTGAGAGPGLDGLLVPVVPERQLDTREEAGALDPWGSATLTWAGLPATAVLGNLTIVDPGTAGFLAAVAAGSPLAGTSAVNADAPGRIVAAAATIAAGGGAVTVTASMRTHVVFDLAGWFTDEPGASMPVAPATVALTGIRAAPRVIGVSVLGRPIVAQRLGTPGGVPVLAVGPIHGNEEQGRRVARAVQSATLPPGVDVWVVEVANPDGLVVGTRTNAAGVDLNRNFDTGSWASVGFGTPTYSGPWPASEPETRALQSFVLEVQPRLAVWWHQASSLRSGHTDDNDLVADRSLLERFAALSGSPLQSTPCGSTGCIGTATTFVNRRVPGSTSFVVELPADADVTAAMVERHAAAFLAAAASASPGGVG